MPEDDLDTQLLNQPTLAGAQQESRASRAWRGLRRGGKDDAVEAGEEAKSLRQATAASRLEKAKEQVKEKVAAPAKMASSWLLRWAWGITASVIGFLPGLLVINMHVFLRWVLGEKLFCKLGQEWVPKQVSAVGGEAGKGLSNIWGMAETIILLILDVITFFIILAIIALLTMVVSFMGAGFWEKIQWIWQAVGTLGWGAVQSLIGLFKVK